MTIVFGRGTCVEHDQTPASTMTATLLNQAIAWSRFGPIEGRQHPFPQEPF